MRPIACLGMAVDVTDATFQTEVVERSMQSVVDRRSVGAVVRAVQDAEPDHREGRRRDQRQGGAGQGQRRREPRHLAGVPGAVDPGRLRPQGRPGRRRVHGRPARARGARVRRAAAADRRGRHGRPHDRDGRRGQPAGGARDRSRQRGRDRRPRRTADRPRRDRGGVGAGGAHPRDRSHQAGRRQGAARASSPTITTRRSTTCSRR